MSVQEIMTKEDALDHQRATVEEARQIARRMKVFVQRRWGYSDAEIRVNPMGAWPRLFFQPEDCQFEFLIRCGKKSLPDPAAKVFCVARIQVSPEHQGKGSEFLQFLVEMLRNTDYTHIEFEDCNQSCSSFCLKHGFEPHPSMPSVYVAPLRDLYLG